MSNKETSDIIYEGLNLSAMKRNMDKMQKALKISLSKIDSLQDQNLDLRRELAKKKDDPVASFYEHFGDKFQSKGKSDDK